jgi:hypothetical protein
MIQSNLFQNRKTLHPDRGNEGEKAAQPVVTIDDLEVLAEQLVAAIRILKTYKYPLSVRRGGKYLF